MIKYPIFALIKLKNMSIRFSLINSILNKEEQKSVTSPKATAIFGENVFTLKTAREYLSDDMYKSLCGSIKSGKKLTEMQQTK